MHKLNNINININIIKYINNTNKTIISKIYYKIFKLSMKLNRIIS